MTRYAVLLRGINVGGAHRLAMADLRALLTSLGHADVETYLQSGQAFVTSEDPADVVAVAVGDALRRELALDVGVLVRTHDQLSAVLAGNPFPAAADVPTTLHAALVDGRSDPDRLPPTDRFAPDAYALGDGVVYLHVPDGLGRSRAGTFDWTRCGFTLATTRSWRTLGVLVDRTA